MRRRTAKPRKRHDPEEIVGKLRQVDVLVSQGRSVADAVSELNLSERRVCRVLGQHRSTQRCVPAGRDDEGRLTADIIKLARRYGRYGYRKVAELLRSTAGWLVNEKRVERIWRRERQRFPQTT